MRRRRRFGVPALGVAALALLLAGAGQAPVRAQGVSTTITADENGHARFTNTAGANSPLASQLGLDAGPGGRPNALLYDLNGPRGLVTGDLFVTEPGGTVGDLIRFNTASFTDGFGEFVFYSLPDGPDLADLAGFPTANYGNTLTIPEVNGVITYTPTAGQPGFVPGAAGPVTYVLTSDVTGVPEPASLTMIGIGAAALAGYVWRRRQQAA
jgi:hypothetical protein